MLLLWDIDGTLLLRAAAAHRDAIYTALREVHGIEIPPGEVETAGMTDRAILRSILAVAGVTGSSVDALMDDTLAAAVAAYEIGCPETLAAHVNPGIPEVLGTLAADGHVHGLVTGNLHAIAARKLRAAGLGAWFADAPGGFGSDAEDRSALPAFARSRAAAAMANVDPRFPGEEPWPAADAVVIGDTPRDIACARADGVGVVAITTGPFDADALAAADAVVASAAALPAALEGWGSGHSQP